MSYRSSYRKWLKQLTAAESIDALSDMEQFFRGGKNWTQISYHRHDGKKCLVGAADHVHAVNGTDSENTKFWLQQAIAERTGDSSLAIETFNDRSHPRRSYREIAEVINRAKQLAAEAMRAKAAPLQLPPPPPATPLRTLSYQAEPAMNDPGQRARQPDPVRARRG